MLSKIKVYACYEVSFPKALAHTVQHLSSSASNYVKFSPKDLSFLYLAIGRFILTSTCILVNIIYAERTSTMFG